MANKETAKNTSEKDSTPKVKPTTDYIKALGSKGAKDRADLAGKVYDLLMSKGIKTNSKGKPISKERLQSLISAMCRDINNEKKGWWANWEVEETNEKFVMRQKPEEAK